MEPSEEAEEENISDEQVEEEEELEEPPRVNMVSRGSAHSGSSKTVTTGKRKAAPSQKASANKKRRA